MGYEMSCPVLFLVIMCGAALLSSCRSGSPEPEEGRRGHSVSQLVNRDPQPGKYRLLRDVAFRGCVRHGGGFEGSGCLEEDTRTFRAGEVIDVDIFFWDDKAQESGAKVAVFGQFRSIPVRHLERVP